MDDRTSKLREALAAYDLLDKRGTNVEPPPQELVMREAARNWLALLESDVLIIRRDDNGNWPEWAVEKVREKLWANSGMPIGSALNLAVLAFDQMASSQGAEHE